MKLGWLFFIGSISLFAAGLTEADDDDDDDYRRGSKYREGQYHEHHRSHRSRRSHSYDHRHRDYHHHQRHRNHNRYDDRKRRRRDRNYFLGGALVGGIATHAFHRHNRYCPDDHYYQRKRRRNHYYTSNSYGECFKVKRRKGRDVYVEVPRHKCY